MSFLFGLSPDCVGVPKDQRVYPLIAMPALVLSVGEKLPLTTTRHLLFHTNDSGQNHFLFRNVTWELSSFLLNPLLLHYLTETDGVRSD